MPKQLHLGTVAAAGCAALDVELLHAVVLGLKVKDVVRAMLASVSYNLHCLP